MNYRDFVIVCGPLPSSKRVRLRYREPTSFRYPQASSSVLASLRQLQLKASDP